MVTATSLGLSLRGRHHFNRNEISRDCNHTEAWFDIAVAQRSPKSVRWIAVGEIARVPLTTIQSL
jgi:hypothetical protein